MIYLCLGMTKSASTLVYQLTEEILRLAGRRPVLLPRALQPLTATKNYFDTVDGALIAAAERASRGRDVVLKSHQRPAPEVLRMIGEGTLLASYAVRDPREVALSMVDHGARAKFRPGRPFAECTGVRACVPSIDHQIESFELVRAAAGPLVLPYNETSFATAHAAARIAAQLGVTVDPAAAARTFASRARVQEFNKGTPLRHRELAGQDSTFFLERYAAFYRSVDLAAGVAEAAATHTSQPRGRMHHELAQVRRWLRGRLGFRL